MANALCRFERGPSLWHQPAVRCPVLIVLCCGLSFAATHAIGPTATGSGSGADWNNIKAWTPSMTLTCGDIYYIADGSYPQSSINTNATCTASSVAEVRKAQDYDHGPAAGWNVSTMGSGQAVFNVAPVAITINSPYVNLNGNGRQSSPGCGGSGTGGSTYTSAPPTPLDCGILVKPTSGKAGSFNAIGTSANDTLEYVEVWGIGNSTVEDGSIDVTRAPGITVSHVFMHNIGCVYMSWLPDNMTITYSYFWGLDQNGQGTWCHSEATMAGSNTINSGTINNSVWRDFNSTALWAWVSPSNPVSNFRIYNNIIWCSSSGFSGCALDDGIFWPGNLTNSNNVSIVQNTAVNLGYSASWYGTNNAGTPTNLVVENNLAYSSSGMSDHPSGTYAYNSYINVSGGCPAQTAGAVCIASGGPNPFVDWQNGNFNLAAENQDWTNRVALSSPYNTDPAGTTRTTDRGAYQFGSGGCTIGPASIGPFTGGQSVSQQFTATNCNPSTYTISSGSLSGSGLALSSSGLLSGTAQAGSYNFTIAYDTGSDPISLTISAPPPPPNPNVPSVLHTTFCGPGTTWPGTCTLSAPTTAGNRLVVAYSSYNSAGSTPVMNAITDAGGDSFSQLPNARSTNTSSSSSWNDIWTASAIAGGQTALTITPSTTQTGDVYVWEVQNASNVVGCASLSSQPAANPAVGAPMTVGTDTLLLSHLHPNVGGNPTAVSAPFTSDLISDQMAYAEYAASAAGTYGPQWTQTAVTFATATCAFSTTGGTTTQVSPPVSLTATAH